MNDVPESYLVITNLESEFRAWCAERGIEPGFGFVVHATLPSHFVTADPRTTTIVELESARYSPMYESAWHRSFVWRQEQLEGRPKAGVPRLLDNAATLVVWLTVMALAGGIVSFVLGRADLAAVCGGAAVGLYAVFLAMDGAVRRLSAG